MNTDKRLHPPLSVGNREAEDTYEWTNLAGGGLQKEHQARLSFPAIAIQGDRVAWIGKLHGGLCTTDISLGRKGDRVSCCNAAMLPT